MLRMVSVFAISVLLLRSGLFPTTQAEEISFSDAYELAIDYAPDVELAQFRVDGAEARKDQALGKLLPQASIFGQWSTNKLSYESDLPIYQDNEYPGQRYGFSLRQPLLAVADGIEVNRQDLLYQLSQDEYSIAEADLLKNLLSAFLDILMSDTEARLIRDELSAVEQQLEESTALYSKSLLPITQVLETESRRDTLSADLVLAQSKSLVAREILFKFTGLRNGEPLPVQKNLALLNRFSDPTDIVHLALESDLAVSAATINASAAEKALLREKSRWIPDVSVNYNYQHSDVGFDNLTTPARTTSTLAVDFRYPIFEGGSRLARIRAATAEYGSARASLRSQKLETEVRARSAWLDFNAASKRMISARKAVTSSDVSVTAARKAVKAGTARYTDVLLALAQRSRSQRDLVYARFTYVNAWTEMELVAGVPPVALANQLSDILHAH